MRIYRKIGEGHRAYVYLCQVLAMKSIENSKLFDKAEKAGMNTQDVFDAMSGHGIFMLVLSRPIAKEKLLNTYYTRQQIEQIFDLCKKLHQQASAQGGAVRTGIKGAPDVEFHRSCHHKDAPEAAEGHLLFPLLMCSPT